jgi:glycosyltransferase involved in cell wall biosynthesis
MSTRPRFSVVVPAHNEADTLPAALASLAAQSCPAPYEVIVVDNASTDATATVAARAGATVVAEPQLGVCRARQTGVAAARGEIVVSTDADTTLPTDWLARIDATFHAHDAAGTPVVAVAGPCRYVDPPWWAAIVPPLWFAGIAAVARAGRGVRYITATNVAFVRDRFPGYDVSLHQGGDEMDLLRTLRRLGSVVWDRDLVVDTSSRRMREGLPYTVLVSYGYYYVGQRLRRRLLGSSAITPAPTVRTADRTRSVRRRRRWGGVTLSLLGGIMLVRIGQRRRPRRPEAGESDRIIL